MTGWRIGWASCGNADARQKTLGRLSDSPDSGVFQAVQEAGVEALTGPQDDVAEMRRGLPRAARSFRSGAARTRGGRGEPAGDLYVWANRPKTSWRARAERPLEEVHIVCTPGNGFALRGRGTCGSP
ncbi:MAG: aminotransferase class I/II-fold pyridoxal phosphate-dependent enzyme [Elusimicrobia bacterium]|nr:aminotransferase class I/II-fold pyridoxal phosphate-dependent enzyme [Elusimicrobiota bacterium]